MTAGIPLHHTTHESGGRDAIQIAQSQVTGLATAIARARLNVLGAWDTATSYSAGDAPHRFGIVYEAVQSNSATDPVSDDGTNWKAIGEHTGQGAIFNADWRDAQLGAQGANSPGVSVINNNLRDVDHTLTQATDRLQSWALPSFCGRPTLRFEARLNDHVTGHNRTEVTATGAGKAWYPGDEMWWAYGWLPHKSYPTLSGTGQFHVFLQLFAEDLFAQGGGASPLAVAVTVPASPTTFTLTPVDNRSFTPTGTVTLGGRTITYAAKDTHNRLTGCVLTSGSTGTISATTTIVQASNSTTLSSGVTLPQASIPVSSTSGFLASGIISVGGQYVTYTSKDATHFLGCTGGTGTITNGSTVNGDISGGSPPLALELTSDGIGIFFHTRGGARSQATDAYSETSVNVAASTVGVMHYFLWHAYLSAGSDGYSECWHSTSGQFTAVPQAEIHGANMYTMQGHALPVYAEFGIYSGPGTATMVSHSLGLRAERTRSAALDHFRRQNAASVQPGTLQDLGDLSALNSAAIDALIPMTVIPPGLQVYDSVNSKVYTRVGTTWKSVTVA